MKRGVTLVAVFAGAAALAIGAPVALAGPPPPSSADAVVARVDDLVAVSHTHADASPDGGAATGDVVELGGKPPAAQFGGTQSGPGSSHNALIDTGDTPLGRIQVTPWDASVDSSNGSTTSKGDASVAKADLLPQNGKPVISLDLLGSSSMATWNSDQSTGHSEANGASLDLADQLKLLILHSETDSATPGSSALLVINGNPVGTGDQLGAVCNINLPPLLQLLCLTATGGNGTPSAAEVLGAQLLNNQQLTGDVVSATSTGGGSTAETSGGNQGGTGVEGNQTENNAPVTAATQSAPLAVTGAGIQRELAIALALAALGVAVLGLARARRAGLTFG